MAFLRIEKKKSGNYMRVVESYKIHGKPKHSTLFSMGKVEDYPPNQLERIATKLLELSGTRIEDIVADDLRETARLNYGYALVIKALWQTFELDMWTKKVNSKHKVRFNWIETLELMIAERLNEPCSKRASFYNQQEYIGIASKKLDLHQFYGCLALLSREQESLKEHIFKTQQSLFSQSLDVVFYDVTTLYFESQVEQEDSLRQKGFCKNGKAHKTHIVLGLLVDKLRNPISYQIYKGNTYEGKTMINALEKLKEIHNIDHVVVVADSAMIDANNRAYIDKQQSMTYILGDRIKNLPKTVSSFLIDKKNHKSFTSHNSNFTYTTLMYKGRKIICTYSPKRARKDAHMREKLVVKAKKMLNNPSVLKQAKKRGAGRFIAQTSKEEYSLDIQKIEDDAKWDGYKALATSTELSEKDVVAKYSDLFEVEHAFRTLKSQLQVRPIYHWTNKRIEGHIAMCFMAYSFLNKMRLSSGLTEKTLIKAITQMQVSAVEEKTTANTIYLRSKLSEEQKTLINSLKLVVPKDTTPQNAINQYFM